VPDLAGERLTWMYTQMLRIREFEERVKRTFEDHPGVIRGHTHLADGAEASIVGSLSHFRSGDAALATYRCHGYPIVLAHGITCALQVWREQIAAYMVFPDRTLIEMASQRPATLSALRQIHGVGDAKLTRYGAAFVAAIGAEGGLR